MTLLSMLVIAFGPSDDDLVFHMAVPYNPRDPIDVIFHGIVFPSREINPNS